MQEIGTVEELAPIEIPRSCEGKAARFPVIDDRRCTKARARRLEIEAEASGAAIDAGRADAVAFGVPYIATPDLAERLQQNAPLNTPNPATFYASGPEGYTDYPAMAA